MESNIYEQINQDENKWLKRINCGLNNILKRRDELGLMGILVSTILGFHVVASKKFLNYVK